MVRVGDMLNKKKSVLHKNSTTMAQKMFHDHASIIPGSPPLEEGEEANKWMGVNFKVFSVLMEELVKWTNVEAEQSVIREVNERHAELSAAFQKIDADKSGMLDGEELKHLCNTLGMPHDQAKIVMKHLDGDGDGKVSFDEFALAVDPGGIKMAQETRPVFAIPSKKDMKAAFKLADGTERDIVTCCKKLNTRTY
jgi:Ca2+-binding EF-hand superfamily protein